MPLARRIFANTKSRRQNRSRQQARLGFINRLRLESLEPRRLMAVVSTDLPRYEPGNSVEIVASDVPSGATVEFSVLAAGADASTAQTWQVADGSQADLDAAANGSIVSTWKLPESAADGQVYNVTARDTGGGETAATQVTAEELTSQAFVQSDKFDYQPMETAIITAGGFQPGEAVEFQVLHIDGRPNSGHGHTPWQVVDGSANDQDGVADGNIITSWYVHEDDSLGAVFSLTASGQSSGISAQSSFTDGDSGLPTTGAGYFGDNFDGTFWNAGSYPYRRWYGDYYRSSTGPINPYGTHAIGVTEYNGNDQIYSRSLDLSGALSVSLIYSVQPGGNWTVPYDTNISLFSSAIDYLYVKYYGDDNAWHTSRVERYSHFNSNSEWDRHRVDFPTSILHDNFRFGFLAADNSSSIDEATWWIDNVTLWVTWNSAPTVTLGNYSVVEGSQVQMTASASDPDAAIFGHTITAYEWQADMDGNGSFETSLGSAQTATFSAANLDGYSGASRQVRVRATDGRDWSAWDVSTVAIANAAPTSATINLLTTSPTEGASVQLSASATDPAGSRDPLTYSWSAYKSGSSTVLASGSGTSFSYLPTDDGSYRFVVTASDGDGGSKTAERTVIVANAAPTITSVSHNGPVFQGSPIVLTVNAQDAAGANDPLTYLFDLDNDGTFEVAQSSNVYAHVFFDSGTHTVGVGVRDDENSATPAASDLTVLSVTPPPELPSDAPRVSFTTGYSAVAETVGSVTLTARLSKTSGIDVVIPLAFSGTTTATSDYTAASQIIILAGQLTGSTSIAIINDTLAEGNETIVARMLPPTNAALATYPGEPVFQTITVLANDAPVVSFTSTYKRVTERDGAVVGVVTLEATLSNASTGRVVVPLAYSGSALAGSDYNQLPATLEFPAGTTRLTQQVILVNDTVAELAEQLTISAGTPSIVMADGSSTPALLGNTTTYSLDIDDDDTPRVSLAASSEKPWEDEGQITVTATLSNPSTQDVTVPLRIAGGTAVAVQDYLLSTQTLVIPAGQTSASATLTVVDDTINEPAETISLVIDQPTNALLSTQRSKTITIRDDDPIVYTSRFHFVEGFPQYNGLTVEVPESTPRDHVYVYLSEATNKDVTVPIYLGGTARSGLDYRMTSGSTVTIPKGSVAGWIDFDIIDDSVYEQTETLVVTLGQPTNAQLPPFDTNTVSRSRTEFISDNDALNVTFATTAQVVDEGVGQVQVKARLSTVSQSPVMVRVAMSGSAKPGWDYYGFETITIPAGRLEGSSTLRIDNDSDIEADEQLVISMVSTSGGELAEPKQFTLTIRSDDFPARVAPSTVAYVPTTTAGQVALNPQSVDSPGPVPALASPDVQMPPSDGSLVVPAGTVALAIGSSSQLTGGVIFLDANKNGVLDAGEVSATTALDGSTLLVFPESADVNGNGMIDASEGQLALAGSIDTATGLPFSSTLLAPLGSYVVSPLTMLMAELVNRQLARGETPNGLAAAQRVTEALGLPQMDLRTLDATYQTVAGNLDAASIYSGQAQVYDTVKQIASLIAGLPGAPPRGDLERLVFADIASKIAEPGSMLSLSNQTVVQSVTYGVLSAVGLTANPELVSGAAAVIAAGNQAIEALPLGAGVAHLQSVAKVKKVAQGEVATGLLMAAVQQKIASVVTNYTGAPLASLIASATIGNVAAPELYVSGSRVTESNTGTVWAEFDVTLVGSINVPVSVDWSTADGSASVSSGDYIAASNTLVWNPGDAATKTVRIQVNGDTTFESDEDILLLLSNPDGAVVRSFVAQAVIVNDDALSYTAPADGADNQLQLQISNGTAFLTRNGELVFSGSISEAPLTISGAAGVSNHLTVHVAAGSSLPAGGIAFVGDGGDRLEVVQDELAETIVHTATAANAGFLNIDGALVNYTGVTTLINGVHASALRYLLEGTAGQSLALGDNSDATDGSSQLDVDGLHIEFVNPSSSLAIDTADGADSVAIDSLDPGFAAIVNIFTGVGDDRIVLHATTGPGAYAIDGGGGNDAFAHLGGTLASGINVAATISAGSNASIAEGAVFSRSGSFTDPGDDSWTATVDYGDGTGAQSLALNPDKTFALSHIYADDGIYTVTVTVSDEDGDQDTKSFTVSVANVLPTLVLSGNQQAQEGVILNLVDLATFEDPGFDNSLNPNGSSVETFSYSIHWGDGTAVDTGSATIDRQGSRASLARLTLGSFDGSHIYADNGQYTVLVRLRDDDMPVGQWVEEQFVVSVANVAPTLAPLSDLPLSGSSVYEGDFIELPAARFSDPGFDRSVAGTEENFRATIDWGDGTIEPFSDITLLETAGAEGVLTTGTIQARHAYGDNGQYTVTVTVYDDENASAQQQFTVNVLNAAPTLDAMPALSVREGDFIELPPARFSDAGFDLAAAGTEENFHATIDWGDGTIEPISDITLLETAGAEGVLTAGTIQARHAYGDNGQYTVTVTVYDDENASAQQQFTVTVQNVAPTLAQLPNLSVVEGDFIQLPPARFSDAGFVLAAASTEENFRATIDWGDGTVEPASDITLLETAGAEGVLTTGTIQARHAYGDNGQYTVTVTVYDDDGGSQAQQFIVDVANAAPRITSFTGSSLNVDASGNLIPFSGVRGQTLYFDGALADAGFNNALNTAEIEETFTYRIVWGDGTFDAGSATAVSGSEGTHSSAIFAGSHVYTSDGTYAVTVIVADDDSGTAQEIYQATIQIVSMQSGGDLAIGGSLTADQIQFSSNRPGETEVFLDGVSRGVYRPTGRLLAFGQAGADDIKADGNISNDVWLYGDDGEDRLKGGAGNDRLFGGLGDDLLAGHSGRDLLVGGHGQDRIVGNADEDILIAGYAAFDYDFGYASVYDSATGASRGTTLLQRDHDGAIARLMAEWTRTDLSYQQRVSSSQASVIAFDDGAADVLTGSADADWFFAQLDGDQQTIKDKITDLHASEFADDLDWIEAE